MRKYEPKQLRPGQVTRYLGAAEALGILPITYIGLTSGLRQGELFTLLWANFHVQDRTILRGKRLLRFSGKATALLTAEHEKHQESPYAFLDFRTGEPYTPCRFYYLHRLALKRAWLPMIGFRDLQKMCKEMEL